MDGFKGWCIGGVTNGVCNCEHVDDNSEGDVIMVMIVIVLLTKVSMGFAKVAPIFMESCLMDVGKKDKNIVVSIKAEGVGCHLVDLVSEILHVDLERFLPVK